MDTIGLGLAVSGTIGTTAPPTLRLVIAAYLARFNGQTRVHTESDLRGYFTWCEQHDLDPSRRPDPTSSSTSAGYEKYAAADPPPSPG